VFFLGETMLKKKSTSPHWFARLFLQALKKERRSSFFNNANTFLANGKKDYSSLDFGKIVSPLPQ